MDSEEGLAQEGQEGVDAPVIAEELSQEEHQPASVDDLASEMGWKPKDQWKGDPEKWKPAAQFLRRTVDVNRSLADEIKGVRSQVETMVRTSAELTARAVAAERERILAERKEAIDLGDHAAVDHADEKLKTLTVTIPPQESPDVAAFKERNAAWFDKDDDATRWAVNRAGELAKQGIGSPARQLAIVEREAKQLFPEFFPEPAKGVPLSKPGPRGNSQPQGKGFTALPADVQAAALDYERRGVCSKDEYAKIYFEQGV